MRPGVRLALDWGKARIGVAACDPSGILAYPVETVAAGPQAIGRIGELVDACSPIEVVLGLPRTLAGTESFAAESMRRTAAELVRAVPGVPIRLVDERLSTRTAAQRLGSAGRNTRRQRAVIDQAAAVAILEAALDHERATGEPPGEVL